MRQRSLPSFEKPEPPDPYAAERWRRGFWGRIARLEREHGKGPSYPEPWRQAILDGVSPEWVFWGMKNAPTAVLRERCGKAYLALERLYKELENGK